MERGSAKKCRFFVVLARTESPWDAIIEGGGGEDICFYLSGLQTPCLRLTFLVGRNDARVYCDAMQHGRGIIITNRGHEYESLTRPFRKNIDEA